MTAETPRSRRPVAVDIFCGAGGLSYGMKRAGIAIGAGIDIDPACRYPFKTNVKADFHERDVSDISPESLAREFPSDCIRVLAGCAPCQPFSAYSMKKKQNAQWQLLSDFGRIVRALLPEIVTMENVPLLEKTTVFREFRTTLEKARYRVVHKIVRCTEYGVPQARRRLVLLASRLGEIEMIPPTRSPNEFATVRDAIQHLVEIEAGSVCESDPLHKASSLSPKNLDRIRNSKPGGTWRDWTDGLPAACHMKATGKTYPSVYGRMQWDQPAPTLTTQFHGFGNGRFGHPVQDRAISLREGALLQTFPEDYSFVPDENPIRFSSVARLIGNAVPVKLGKAIGKSIVAHLESCDDR